MKWTEKLDREIDAAAEAAVQVRRHLHAFPEPSGHEVQTTRYLRERLRELGLAVRTGPQERGLIVDPKATAVAGAPRRGGISIALRADIDALRIQDAKTVPYRSRVPGVMHACGHDGHAATVLLAIRAMWAMMQEGALPWPVSWRGIFQPEEETNRGARAMIQAGALDGVSGILSLHMDPSRPSGVVAVRSGVITADCDEIEIEIHGRGGHASRPHESLDPVAVAAQLITAVYTFVPRSLGPHEPVVVTIGVVRAGENSNVIPDRVILGGTLRSLSAASRRQAMGQIRQIAAGLSEASGARIALQFKPGPPSVSNDAALTELLVGCAREAAGVDNVLPSGPPSMGGEDFAHYLAHLPGCMFRLGCADTEGVPVTLHSPLFDLDERCIALGAKVLARAVIKGCETTK